MEAVAILLYRSTVQYSRGNLNHCMTRKRNMSAPNAFVKWGLGVVPSCQETSLKCSDDVDVMPMAFSRPVKIQRTLAFQRRTKGWKLNCNFEMLELPRPYISSILLVSLWESASLDCDTSSCCSRYLQHVRPINLIKGKPGWDIYFKI